MLCKRRGSQKYRQYHRETPVLESLFNKVAGLNPTTLLKRDSKKVFSCEYCKIFKNTYFEYLGTIDSELRERFLIDPLTTNNLTYRV